MELSIRSRSKLISIISSIVSYATERLWQSGKVHGHFYKNWRNEAARFWAYADDVALLVKGKFLNIVYNLTQGYLNVVTRWAERN